MRRPPTAALVGVLIVILVGGSLVVGAHEAHLDLLALQAAQIIDAGKTFSRIAADRPCPSLGPEDVRPRRIDGTLQLVPVASAEEPTSVALLPDGSGDGFLAERPGTVRRIEAGKVTSDLVLDVTDDTLHQGDAGLLALAVDPSGAWLYAEHTTKDYDDVITAYPVLADGRVEAHAGREIVRSGHPSSIQHHGGSLAFDDEGRLYFGFGDGGGLGDPRENAQKLSTLLGKINRVLPTPGGKVPYEIPRDNPFVGRDGARPEIWVYGVRNPFRLFFDPPTQDVWLGDVGQSCWEELDRLPADAGGANLGWDLLEGTHRFEDGSLPKPVHGPQLEISHRRGWCAIVAGPVQRGGALPSLEGRALISDYCKGALWAVDPEHPEDVVDTGLQVTNTIAVVPGPAGRPWVLTLDGHVLEVREG